MKKVLSMILALTLIVALAVPAFAADTLAPNAGASDQDVTATYDKAVVADPATVYYVTVAWTEVSNTIKFTEGTKAYKWNGTTMYYEEDAANSIADAWSGTAEYNITVTNQSNGTVNASAAWAAASGITVDATVGAAVAPTTAAVSGGTAIEFSDTTTQGTAQTGTINVQVATPTAGTISADSTIGTITVTITSGS